MNCGNSRAPPLTAYSQFGILPCFWLSWHLMQLKHLKRREFISLLGGAVI
jgi:hypothetical protein